MGQYQQGGKFEIVPNRAAVTVNHFVPQYVRPGDRPYKLVKKITTNWFVLCILTAKISVQLRVFLPFVVE